MSMERSGRMGNREDEALEARMTRALEAAPAVAIPEDFARRVAMKMPARALAGRRTIAAHNVGLRVAWAVAAMLLVAMFSLAALPLGLRAGHWLEFAMGTEFAALTAWLIMGALRRSS